MFGLMIWAFYLRFSIPVLGVFYGTSLIADEVEDKTITYLFTRPIPRGGCGASSTTTRPRPTANDYSGWTYRGSAR